MKQRVVVSLHVSTSTIELSKSILLHRFTRKLKFKISLNEEPNPPANISKPTHQTPSCTCLENKIAQHSSTTGKVSQSQPSKIRNCIPFQSVVCPALSCNIRERRTLNSYCTPLNFPTSPPSLSIWIPWKRDMRICPATAVYCSDSPHRSNKISLLRLSVRCPPYSLVSPPSPLRCGKLWSSRCSFPASLLSDTGEYPRRHLSRSCRNYYRPLCPCPRKMNTSTVRTVPHPNDYTTIPRKCCNMGRTLLQHRNILEWSRFVR